MNAKKAKPVANATGDINIQPTVAKVGQPSFERVGKTSIFRAQERRSEEQLSFDFEQGLEVYSSVHKLMNSTGWSNISHLYDLVPKQVTSAAEKRQTIVNRRLMFNGRTVIVMIKPATTDSGKLSYPGLIEERVENALVYLASRGNTVADATQKGFRVNFTISGLQKTILELFNKRYSFKAVKSGLDLLSSCQLTLKEEFLDDKGNVVSLKSVDPRITGLVTLDRHKLGADAEEDSDTTCSCSFHCLKVNEIIQGRFFIHDLTQLAKINTEVGQTLYRQLSVFYRFASVERPFSFLASEILQFSSSGHSDTNIRRQFSKIRDAIKTLVNMNILQADYTEEPIFDNSVKRVGRRSPKDFLFTIASTEQHQERVYSQNSGKKKLIAIHKENTKKTDGSTEKEAVGVELLEDDEG